MSVPLIIYLVGISDTHVAFTTAAVGVAVNAVIGLINHARADTVQWEYAACQFAAAGVAGAYIGSTIGKTFDDQKAAVFVCDFDVAVVGCLLLLRKQHLDIRVIQTRSSVHTRQPNYR